MKHIRKSREPNEFAAWKQTAIPGTAQRYQDLAGKPRESLVKSLLSEQGDLCCYCMRRISAADSHVEHFRPQTHYPKRDLEYSNLLASCSGEHDDSPPLHCGHAKGNRPAPGTEDEHLLLSPLSPDCERFFRYTLEGEVLPTDEDDRESSAERTISILKLDEPNLQAQRKRALTAVINLLKAATFDEIEDEIALYGKRSRTKQFAPFCAAIIYILKWYR